MVEWCFWILKLQISQKINAFKVADKNYLSGIGE